MFEADVFAQTEEQYVILLKTNEFTSVFRVLESKLERTLLIWQSFEKHEDATFVMWLLYVRVGSKNTPKSLADETGFKRFPRKESVGVGSSLFNCCLVPTRRNFVLSGFISSSFSQHQVATSCKSF